MSIKYNWDSYSAIENGKTIFSARNLSFQKAAALSASFLEDRVVNALEFGVGEGTTAKYFSEVLPKMNLISLDVDSEAIQAARKNLSRYQITFLEEDFLQHTVKNYDLIFRKKIELILPRSCPGRLCTPTQTKQMFWA